MPLTLSTDACLAIQNSLKLMETNSIVRAVLVHGCEERGGFCSGMDVEALHKPSKAKPKKYVSSVG